MKNKKSRVNMVLAVIAVVLAAVLAMLTAWNHLPAQRVRNQVALGQKYLSELQYDKAILAFSRAAEIDEKNVEARMGLGDAYMQKAYTYSVVPAGNTVSAEETASQNRERAALYAQAVKAYKAASVLRPEAVEPREKMIQAYDGQIGVTEDGTEKENLIREKENVENTVPGDEQNDTDSGAVSEEQDGEQPGEEQSGEQPGEEQSGEQTGEEQSGEQPGEEPSEEESGQAQDAGQDTDNTEGSDGSQEKEFAEVKTVRSLRIEYQEEYLTDQPVDVEIVTDYAAREMRISASEENILYLDYLLAIGADNLNRGRGVFPYLEYSFFNMDLETEESAALYFMEYEPVLRNEINHILCKWGLWTHEFWFNYSEDGRLESMVHDKVMNSDEEPEEGTWRNDGRVVSKFSWTGDRIDRIDVELTYFYPETRTYLAGSEFSYEFEYDAEGICQRFRHIWGDMTTDNILYYDGNGILVGAGRIHMGGDENIISITCDQNRILGILDNTLSSGYEFRYDGGSVTEMSEYNNGDAAAETWKTVVVGYEPAENSGEEPIPDESEAAAEAIPDETEAAAEAIPDEAAAGGPAYEADPMQIAETVLSISGNTEDIIEIQYTIEDPVMKTLHQTQVTSSQILYAGKMDPDGDGQDEVLAVTLDDAEHGSPGEEVGIHILEYSPESGWLSADTVRTFLPETWADGRLNVFQRQTESGMTIYLESASSSSAFVWRLEGYRYNGGNLDRAFEPIVEGTQQDPRYTFLAMGNYEGIDPESLSQDMLDYNNEIVGRIYQTGITPAVLGPDSPVTMTDTEAVPMMDIQIHPEWRIDMSTLFYSTEAAVSAGDTVADVRLAIHRN